MSGSTWWRHWRFHRFRIAPVSHRALPKEFLELKWVNTLAK